MKECESLFPDARPYGWIKHDLARAVMIGIHEGRKPTNEEINSLQVEAARLEGLAANVRMALTNSFPAGDPVW